MTADANSSIEETGINLLHVAFGFLEWFESKDSDVARLAPLLLAPVSLHRDKVIVGTECYRYKVAYEGEDLQQNMSLREKLRQDFALVLPEFDPDDALPEEFFERVKQAVAKSQPRWRVRRRLVLGFFHFSKLRLYLDLDPANWPDTSSITDHAVVKDLLEGRESGDALPKGEEKEPDPNESLEVLPLVVDADSSQLRALRATQTGKNIVIEGPPGTGKSQTITNLIAGALAARKSVLFVADKLAALEVVRRNLDRAGLGDFCLELHSRKAKKRTLLDDLDRRLRKKYEHPPEWDQRCRDHSTVRDKLSDLSLELETVHQGLEEPIWRVLWKTNLFREQFRAHAPLDIPGLQDLSNVEVTRRKEFVEDLVHQYLQSSPTTNHPWRCFYATRLLPLEVDRCLQTMRDLVKSLEAIKEGWKAISSKTGLGVAGSLRNIDAFVESVTNLPEPDFPEPLLEILPRLLNPSLGQRLADFERDISRCKALRLRIELVIPGDPAKLELSALQGEISGAERVVKGDLTLEEISATASKLQSALAELAYLAPRIKDLPAAPGVRPSARWGDALAEISLLALVRSAPPEVAESRWRGHLSDRAPAILKQAREEARLHEEERIRLSEVFLHTSLSDEKPLVEAIAAYGRHEHRFFRFLSAGFRGARRYVSSLLRPGTDTAGVTYWLERLLEFQRRENSPRLNDDWVDILGPLYKGPRSPWERLEVMIGWSDQVRKTCPAPGTAIWLFDNLVELSNNAAADLATRATSLDSLLGQQLMTASPMLESYRERSLADLTECLKNMYLTLTGLLAVTSSISVGKGVTLAQLRSATNCVADLRKAEKRVTDSDLREELGGVFQSAGTDIAQVRMAAEWVSTIDASSLPPPVKEWLISSSAVARFAELRAVAETLGTDRVAAKMAFAKLDRWGRFRADFVGAESPNRDQSGEAHGEGLLPILRRALDSADRLSKWAEYCRLLPKAHSLGLTPFVEALEKGQVPTELAANFFLFAVYVAVSESLVTSSPKLAAYTRTTIENAIDRFRKRDEDILALSARRLAFLAAGRHVPVGVGRGAVNTWTELALLEREISKKKRHIPIRQLVNRAGGAIAALKPCFMMSPLSVAQFLEPGQHSFDLVLMDEASQLRPEEALGAIARGAQVVVVGDPKQLPPTSFFDRVMDHDDDEEEEGVADDTESILDVCMRAYRPTFHLNWHYRSRHESLIAFSNAQFYENELLIFPSPSLEPGEMGIRHNFVSGATYAGRRNLAEAQAVVKRIVTLAQSEPDLSLGVAAFNGPQRDLIEDLLEEAGKKDSRVANVLEKLAKHAEPFFIKNLENVQGDERDVIIISYTYGPDPQSGKVFQRFGPTNGVNGWRRLNVLVTRAKKRVEVFTSMRPTDIHPAPGQRGVESMRAYLEYAETGRWKDPGNNSEREPDSEFEVMVTSILERHGYRCRPQVGVAGFFIDIGVLHPDHPTEFLLGVECDGATYHSTAAIRDRDRLRQEILESRGWRIHRVWSTDWWMNPEGETLRLVETIERLRQG